MPKQRLKITESKRYFKNKIIMKKFLLILTIVGASTIGFAKTSEKKVENSTAKSLKVETSVSKKVKKAKSKKGFIPVHTSCGTTAYVYYNSNSTLWDVLNDAWELDALVCGE